MKLSERELRILLAATLQTAEADETFHDDKLIQRLRDELARLTKEVK